VHTPFVESNSYDLRYVDIEPSLPLIERIEIVTFYLPVFCKMLKSIKFGKEQNYEAIIVMGGVPRQYLFKLSDIRSAVIVGKFPSPESLPSEIREKLYSK
jgi:hypothetical protein